MYKKLRDFFWFCSGVNDRILEECDTDHSKYFAIGATVFFTACFAGLSGSYAMYFVFSGSQYASLFSLAFGLLWGFAIFNIDRYLIISIRKENRPIKEFFAAMPRIILALMIGIVIARPLELKIFEKEINEGLKQYFLENQQSLNQTAVDNFNIRYEGIFEQLRSKISERDQVKLDLSLAEKLRDAECYGKILDGRTSGQFGDGPNCKLRKEEVSNKLNIYNNYVREVSDLESQITALREQSGLNKATYLDVFSLDSLVKLSGFYDRSKILGQISSWTPFDFFTKKKLESSAQIENNAASKGIGFSSNNRLTDSRFDGENDKTVFFISMLIILIECLPIVVKLMSKRGVYDEKLAEEESLSLFLSRNENISNKYLIKELGIAQREVLDNAITEWKNQEMNDLNLSNNYINRKT